MRWSLNFRFLPLQIIAGCLFAMTGLPMMSEAAGGNADAVVEVNASVVSGSVNRQVLGNNLVAHSKFMYPFFDRTGGGLWDPVLRRAEPNYAAMVRDAGVSALRWPGGPWDVDWTAYVGPESKRRDHAFGLNEFLRYCEEIHAIPLITLPIAENKLSQIADLVEYLNAESDGSNPNGGVDWAKKREEDGRKKPWGVVWFEFGSETYNEIPSVKEYVRRYLDVYDKIQRIDPNVKLGAVLQDNDNTESGWSYVVASELGKKMGFAIVHLYFPTILEGQAKVYSEADIAASALASDAQFERRLRKYNTLIKDVTGRKDLPVVVSEFNGLFIQDQPIKFRFSQVNAIHVADSLRIMLQPDSNVAMANFFQLANSYWGMLQSDQQHPDKIKRQAVQYVYELYNRYLGNQLVSIHIDSPSYESKGIATANARTGKAKAGNWKPYAGAVPGKWSLGMFSGASHDQDGGKLRVVFDGGKDVNYYHAIKKIAVKPNTLYRVKVRARSLGLENGSVGIALEDERGWVKTNNQPSNMPLAGTTDWQWITCEIRTLPDARNINIMARRLGGHGVIAGTAEFAEMFVEENDENPGEVKSVEGIASIVDKDGSVLVLLINKELSKTVPTQLKIAGNYRLVTTEVLGSSSPYDTNMPVNAPEKIKVTPLSFSKQAGGGVLVQLPPTSLAGFRFQRLSGSN